jgi:hypothetical protein
VRPPLSPRPVSLPVTNVVQAGVADRPALLDVVELLAVVGKDGIESTTGRVRQEVQILLALPLQIVDMCDLMPGQDPLQCRQERLWNVLIQKQPHTNPGV